MAKPRKKKPELSAIGRMLLQHKSMCNYFTYSGDRHCSCGRDNALGIMQAARVELGEEKFEKLFGKVFPNG